MTHLHRFKSITHRDPLQRDAEVKLATWADYCESCEVGVGIPGLDQTLIMWAIRRGLKDMQVEMIYCDMDWQQGVMIEFGTYRFFRLFDRWAGGMEIQMGDYIAREFKHNIKETDAL